MTTESIIDRMLGKREDYIYGFSDLTGLLCNKYQSYPFGIAIGKKLDDRIIDSISRGPNIAYYNLYERTNQELSLLLMVISEKLQSRNISHVAIAPTMTDSEISGRHMKNLSADFSHKMAATRAGLGWIGKTDLFISERFGPRLRLATILTGLPLPVSSRPINESRCGTCMICVKSCPAGAANGKSWTVATTRDEFYDASLCRETCRKMTKINIGIDASLCGICVSVCPIGKKNRHTA
ncbi:MAG: epoxyqueuosine reductase [Chrysiogenales bacterium]|nr:MAG: epoxyqueuosine reductase [Chrysiogenales bacterium]